MSKGRIAGAVLAGAAFWAVAWVAAGLGAGRLWPAVFVSGQRLDHTGALLGFLALSVVLSSCAGLIAAAIERSGSKSVKLLAAVQLILGTIIEIAAWHATPVWYHVAFLTLIVPATLLGGVLYRGRPDGSAPGSAPRPPGRVLMAPRSRPIRR